MATYIVFLKNLKTGEEFAVPHMAADNSHDLAMAELRSQYPANRFAMHTAYTVAELQNIMENATRWPGVASKVQTGTVQAPKRRKDVPMKADSIFASGSMLKAKPLPQKPKAEAQTKAQTNKMAPKVSPALAAMMKKQQAAAAQQPQAQAAAPAPSTAAPTAGSEGMSVIHRLKMMQGK